MTVDSINNGIVIDHIEAGKSMLIYRYLKLDKLECPIALIKNVSSKKMGKKDIIKIDADIDVDLDILGYIDPGITINAIKNGKLTSKRHLALPKKIDGVIKCKNPRCITSVEQEIVHSFKLVDEENGVYRCIYCESKAKEKSYLDSEK